MSDRLVAGQSLNPGEHLESACGRFHFEMRPDGNAWVVALQHIRKGRIDLEPAFCPRKVRGGPLGTVRYYYDPTPVPGSRLLMKENGLLELLAPDGRRVGGPHTGNHPGAYLILQADANLVLYDTAGRALWARDTTRSNMSDWVVPGRVTVEILRSTLYPAGTPGTGLIINDFGTTVAVRAPDTKGYETLPPGGRCGFARLPGTLEIPITAHSTADSVPVTASVLEKDGNGGLRIKQGGLPLVTLR